MAFSHSWVALSINYLMPNGTLINVALCISMFSYCAFTCKIAHAHQKWLRKTHKKFAIRWSNVFILPRHSILPSLPFKHIMKRVTASHQTNGFMENGDSPHLPSLLRWLCLCFGNGILTEDEIHFYNWLFWDCLPCVCNLTSLPEERETHKWCSVHRVNL